MAESIHIPVMLNEVIEHLNLRNNAVIVDGTLGAAGHASEILKRIGSDGKLIGIDRDVEILSKAKETLTPFLSQCELIHNNYSQIDEILRSLKITDVDGILLDLGVSSYQLDTPHRGFSVKNNGPLDMRMDPESEITAFDLVNSLPEKELSVILKVFGEERWHQRIARQIVKQRSVSPIRTTDDLSRVVLKAMPKERNWQKIHPATRTFQGLRIAVNKELQGLETALDKCIECLKREGRIAVIAFHSLEDRIVKHKFKDFQKAGKINLITKKPLRPSDLEAKENVRARSARLRIAERI